MSLFAHYDPSPGNARNDTPLRAKARALITNRQWERGVIALIIINAIILGFETVPSVMAEVGPTLLFTDRIILWMFVIELSIRLYVHRLSFFRDPWSLFDSFVIAIAFIPDGGAFSVLRALRVLRVLRLVSAIPSLRRVVAGLLAALPGMTSIFGLMLIFFYVAAVMSTKLFGTSNPELFGNLATSAFTLFQVMTLEGWSDEIVRPVMDNHPYAWAFFVPFILLATFTMLNLFIAVMVSAIQIEHDEVQQDIEDIVHDDRDEILREIRALRKQVEELKGDGSEKPVET